MGAKKKKKPSPAKIKARLKKKCDILWSSITKQIHRAKFGASICAWCAKIGPIQSDHIFNRWKHSTRWDVRNCIGLCYACHIFKKEREPLAWAEVVQENIPPDVYADLKAESEKTVTVSLDFLQQTFDHLTRLDKDKPWEATHD